ncbi:MAG: leucyl aminopeptidase [Ignavibacteria bacterium]|nr:leucyl aminopeptidase [Ignavibacteria bacterium]
MYFKLNIQSAKDEIKFDKDSGLVKFFVDSNNLEKHFNNFYESLNKNINPLQKKNFLDKKGDALNYYSEYGEPSNIYIKKVKIDDDFTIDFFRNYFAGLISDIRKIKINSIHVVVPSFNKFKKHFGDEVYFLQTMVEGFGLGNYSFDKYKSSKDKTESLNVIFHYTNQNALKKSIQNALNIIDSVYFTRDLVNEPAITLTPIELGRRTKKKLSKFGIKTTILDKRQLIKRKMNAILSVGGASENQPCMIVMSYKPKIKPRKKIALVGKGVTYDSGGLSIKPTSGMLKMKADMAGGAVVIGTLMAAAKLKLPIQIIGIVPAAENMIGGKSYKPGDIIRAYSGKSIEVKDTDAEGRIILADALHYASQQKPDEIIDFATLTGACAVALGLIAAGLFTKNDQLSNKLINSGQRTFERVWRLPFWNDYNSQIKSEIADVSNLGPRWGGAITAGKFLEHFVDKKIPWAHLDIAGPAIKHELTNYTKEFDTGFGVRLMVDYLSTS